ncbi:hypothetical protein ABID22_000130 [Pontibacter aydingkolensis]|uniref:DUF6046 domain-containing protein n=1 Tax=Pontibacter aydingkolensis TaxID=1911536 RepID=A0ABS7CQS3_9BACT|nr:DUF6046 domain-containing protein [Pontibacter aydingkolensis]MBW7466202.1 hypothetical protein [Pontibacter aydingkolensis]
MERDYQLPKTYQQLQTNKLELVTTTFANAYVKPALYEKAFGDTSAFLGRQLITTVKLVLPDYEIEKYDLRTSKWEKVTVPGDEILLDTVLVEISSSKNIVQTAINGMHGTVKEYISNGDYEVTISGAIVSKGKGFPAEEVRTLNNILHAPIAIKVESELLSLFSIYNLVVTSDSFPSREGYTNTQLFSFNALSDEPLELKL